MSTIRRLDGWRRKKEPKHERARTQESGSDNFRSEARRQEKWVVRHRLPNGRLKHLCTLRHKPTDKDLAPYGFGEYTVQKSAGGRFSKSEKIRIERTPQDPPSRRLSVPDLGSERLDRRPTREHRRPPQAPTKLPSPSTTPSSDRKMEKAVSDAIRRLSSPVKSERRSSANGRGHSTTDDGKKRDIESIVSETSESLMQFTKEASARAPKRQIEKPESAISSKERLQLESQLRGKTVDSSPARPSEDARLRVEPKPPSSAPTAKTISVPKPKEKKYISCTKCGDSICEEDELWSFKYSGKRCEYCHQAYCNECFEEHVCRSSVVCSHCGKRFSTALDVFQAEYCRRIFCSRRCAHLCFGKNKDTPECQGCGNREDESEEEMEEDTDEEVEEGPEDAEEGDQDEGEEWWYLPCSNCDILIRNDDPTNIECMDCEEEFFCSWLCFKRYHRRKRLDHEGMTFGESYDWEEERSRKSRVVVTKSKRSER